MNCQILINIKNSFFYILIMMKRYYFITHNFLINGFRFKQQQKIMKNKKYHFAVKLEDTKKYELTTIGHTRNIYKSCVKHKIKNKNVYILIIIKRYWLYVIAHGHNSWGCEKKRQFRQPAILDQISKSYSVFKIF